MSKIKTRDVVKDVKTFDRAANLSQRMKDGAAKTKETAEEQVQETRHESPTAYATDSMTDGGKIALHKARQMSRQPVRRVQKSSEELGRAARDAKRAYQELRTSGKTANAAKGAKGTGAAKSTQGAGGTKAARGAKRTKIVKGAKGARTVKAPAEKTIRTATKTVKETGKTIKTASKTTVKTAKVTGKAVKTSAGGTKVATKGAVLAAKSSAKATVTAVQMAKLSFAKAKLVALKAKLVAKAVIATVKLAIAAVKSLVAIIMMGGWVVVVILLILGMVGLFIASPFGIFFAGEDSTESALTMPEVVAELTAEFYSQIDDIQAANAHDDLEMGMVSIRWNEALAVYAVKTTTDPEGGMDVVTLDEERVGIIRGVLHDMVSISYSLRTEMIEETVTDEYGYETIESVPFIVLVITLTHRTPDEIAEIYGFDNDQRALLQELLDPEFDHLWAMLLGGFAPGPGVILTGNENFVPLGIFAWPLEDNWPITSPFGWRIHPISGEKSLHRCIDIALPTGTPIRAAHSGVVTVSQFMGGFGNVVFIVGDDGIETRYAHDDTLLVSVGDTVEMGDIIATVGSTGNSTGPHLHFEILVDGSHVNPAFFAFMGS